MDKRISDILKDIYTIDPEMKAHEKELSRAVSEIVQAKPETHFNEQFASKLRSELMQEKVARPLSSPYTSLLVSRVFYGVLGSVLTVLIAVPLTYVATQKATSPDKPVVLNPFTNQVKNITFGLTLKQQISDKGINAFGKLDLLPTTQISPKGSEGAALTSPRTFGAAGVSSVNTSPEKYDFTYKGDPVSLTESDGKVFKRTKGIDSGKQLNEIIRNSKLNLADLSTFGTLNLKDIKMTEDKAFGYTVDVNFTDGAIAISPQWQYWDQPKDAKPLSMSDVLDDSSLISITNTFLKDHGIDTAIYGNPIVGTKVSNSEGQNPVVSDVVTITYPLIIDKKEVQESNGAPFGLMITVDVRQKKVSGVTNLTSQTYESSEYKLETDFSNVINAATSSVVLGALSTSTENQEEPMQIVLGTPKQVLMHYWFSDSKAGSNDELYIPAMSFPVKYGNKNQISVTVVVPLVKDFIGKQSQVQPDEGKPLSINQ